MFAPGFEAARRVRAGGVGLARHDLDVGAVARSKRTRGPNKQQPWSRDPAAGLSVLRLALDAGDPLVRKRLERVFGAAFSMRRRTTLAAHLVFEDAADPRTAVVDYAAAAASLEHAATTKVLRSTLYLVVPGRQDALSESTAPSALDGWSAGETRRTSTATRLVARRIVGTAPRATPDETVDARRTTPDRARMRTDLPAVGGIILPSLRDSS
jgi:hypothetical protein